VGPIYSSATMPAGFTRPYRLPFYPRSKDAGFPACEALLQDKLQPANGGRGPGRDGFYTIDPRMAARPFSATTVTSAVRARLSLGIRAPTRGSRTLENQYSASLLIAGKLEPVVTQDMWDAGAKTWDSNQYGRYVIVQDSVGHARQPLSDGGDGRRRRTPVRRDVLSAGRGFPHALSRDNTSRPSGLFSRRQ